MKTNKLRFPVLRTKRLVLKKIRRSDAADMFEYASNPAVSRFTLWRPHRGISETKRYIGHVINNYRRGVPENWGIYRRSKLIGTCGFFEMDLENERAEVNYALSADYSGMGLMTEAVKKVMRYGFESLKLRRIQAKCMVQNRASEKVMKKAGMKYEGTLKSFLRVKGKFRDMKLYAATRSGR
ncbi:MAG: GNAT family N-acetyltransferase [Endomicrobiales bacterium]|nr:GNAT family N-acetyltransferase [Endomicrobiales bacterium]